MVGAKPLDAGREEGGGGDQAHLGAELLEQQQVGARHPGMGNIARDRHHQAFDPLEAAADGQGIEQRLGRVLVLAVAGIDDGAGHLARQQLGGTRSMVAHDQQVRLHGVEGHGGVEQGLALRHRGGTDRHVHDIGAEPLAGELEGALGAGRGLEEQVDLGAAGQHRLLLADLPVELDIAVGEIENGDDLLAGQRRDGENMPAFQDRRRRRGGELCSMGHQSAVYRKTRANRQ